MMAIGQADVRELMARVRRGEVSGVNWAQEYCLLAEAFLGLVESQRQILGLLSKDFVRESRGGE